jgi:hypothetical protein
VGDPQHAHICSAALEVSSAHRLADTRFTCGHQYLWSTFLARPVHDRDPCCSCGALHGASDRTALLDSRGMPLIGTMSLLYFDVSFPVSRLKPVNWMVAPSTLSISDPTRPAASPAAQSHVHHLQVQIGS